MFILVHGDEERPDFLHKASALEASSQVLFFVIFIGLKLSYL